MSHLRPPLFLQDGTFLWDMSGYFYAEPPPKNLGDAKMVGSKEPWLALAAILEQAKSGNHEPVGRLVTLADFNLSWDFARSCLALLGDAGTKLQVERLVDVLVNESKDYPRVAACDAALHAGYLWLVPYMLEAWNGVRRHAERDAISLFLSTLLEEEPGPIIANEGYSVEEYNQLVNRRVSELEDQHGTDQLVLFAGRPFHVVSLARSMLALVRTSSNEPGISEEFHPLRHRFEASTGINCSSFFREGALRPLSAAAILESFLEGPERSKYQEGVRYFFGHRVPA